MYGHVTLMVTLRQRAIDPGLNGCVRLSSIIPLLQMLRLALDLWRRVKRQKVTFDLSLLKNVRGCNRSRRATNGRVGTRWLRSSARSSSPLGKLNGTTRMNRSDR